ncbi:MAG: hypothetical protein KAG95_06545 [Bacteroidales bacterium]|nr:hypothetical protein [Bacteroidales bacterium]
MSLVNAVIKDACNRMQNIAACKTQLYNALISNGIYAVEYDKKNKRALAQNKIIICHS